MVNRRTRRPAPSSLATSSAQRRRGTTVRAQSPADIVAAMPYQCGFQPTRSVLVVSLRGPRRRIGLVSRLDLPPAQDAQSAAELLAGLAADDGARASIVLVYDEPPFLSNRAPHAALVAALRRELDVRGAPAMDVIYVSPERFWSYDCSDPRCCPPEGNLLETTRSTSVAAAYVMAGLAPLPTRDSLSDRLTAVDRELVREVADRRRHWLEIQAAELDRDVRAAAAEHRGAAFGIPIPRGRLAEVRREHLRRWTAATFELVEQLLLAYRDGASSLDADQSGRLLASLESRDIRDAVLVVFCRSGLAMSPTDDLDGLVDVGVALDPRATAAARSGAEPDPSGDDAVERLLVDLSVRATGAAAAAPLTMVGWHSWARGHGAFARIAVERALAEDPAYRLAVLLEQILDRVVPPAWVAGERLDDEQAS